MYWPALGLAACAALAASAVWAFNFHGINMALLWFSGPTSLLGTLFSTLAALALTRNRGTAGVLALMAFLSKEEVVALPLVLTLWLISGSSVKRSLGLWIALAIYFALREYAGAVGISNAPPYYRFNFDPARVATNIVEYADPADGPLDGRRLVDEDVIGHRSCLQQRHVRECRAALR